jgi:hypothetical protein
MSQKLKAVYRRGAFLPKAPCDVPEDSEVELVVHGPFLLAAEAMEPSEREHILKMLVKRMLQNPLPTESPRFSRDELHERR